MITSAKQCPLAINSLIIRLVNGPGQAAEVDTVTVLFPLKNEFLMADISSIPIRTLCYPEPERLQPNNLSVVITAITAVDFRVPPSRKV